MNGKSEKQISYALNTQAKLLAEVEKISHYYDSDPDYAIEARMACDRAADIIRGFTDATQVLDLGWKVVSELETICTSFAPDRGYGYEFMINKKARRFPILSGNADAAFYSAD